MLRPWLVEELEPYLDVRREGRRLADFAAELTDVEQDALSRIALIMLRPDALLAGTAVPILDWLEQEHGVALLRLSIRRVDPRSFDGQYVTELPLIAPGLWLHHRIAGAGPTAFGVVTGTPKGDRSFAVELDDLKGASSPGQETDTSTLRSRFGRQSSFHVVLHTSEDAGDFLQGAIGVFGWDATRRLLHDVAAGAIDPVPPRFRDLLLGELAAPANRSVYEIVLSVKQRILAVLASSPHPLPDDLVAAIDECYTKCELTPFELFAEKRERFMQMAIEERPLLVELIERIEAVEVAPPADEVPHNISRRWAALESRTARRRLAYATWLLSGHDEYDLDPGDRLFDLLAANSIVLSDAEQTLLNAAIVCDVNPGATFAGRRTYPLDPPG